MPCLTCGELVLWKTAFPQQGMQHFHEIYSLGFHLKTWKCNKNGATEPSWVKIRSSTGPRETRVPAVPEQLLLLRVPLSTAPCCTDMRNVSDVQSSSRTALAVSVVHLLTEIMSWPRQSLTLHTCEYCTRRLSGPIYVPLCSYIWFFKSFHALNCCEVDGLSLSCESWCITVLMIGVFSAATAGPAELFWITTSTPHCVRFFATSALESTVCKQIEEWQVQHKKTAKMRPHVQWLLSLAASYCGEAWGHLPCLRCLPRPLFHSETQRPSWTAIFRGVDNWIRMK